MVVQNSSQLSRVECGLHFYGVFLFFPARVECRVDVRDLLLARQSRDDPTRRLSSGCQLKSEFSQFFEITLEARKYRAPAETF